MILIQRANWNISVKLEKYCLLKLKQIKLVKL